MRLIATDLVPRGRDWEMCNVEGQGGTAVEISKRETAQYMADMPLEMRNMAKAAGFVTLISLFELSFCEAFAIANYVEPPEGEIERINELSRAANGV